MGIPVTITLFGSIFFFLQIIQTFHLLAASAAVQSHTERLLTDKSGFISIACGIAANSSYYYEPNGLYYTSDERYISTGKNFQVSPTFYLNDSRHLGVTLRSFPEGLRNCYTLSPLKPSNTYLIRTRFVYGNYDGKNSIPEFDVYVGVNFWFTFTLPGVVYTLYKEIIHVATSESVEVCLVNTGKGTPFISALELRPLDNSSYPATPAFSLVTSIHMDIGSIGPTSFPEVKDDAYDRLWVKSMTWRAKAINTSESFDASQESSLKIPISVLKTAVVQNDSPDNLTLSFPVDDPTTQFIVYWHFAEVELLPPNQTREFNIFVPGYKTLGPIKPKYLQLTTIASPRMSFNVKGNPIFTLKKTKESTHYPIFNAIETYSILELPASPTNQEDVDAIAAIKDKYAIPRIWQGDPCLPKNYQWDGLNCTYGANNPPRIISLSLSSSNLIGELPPSLIKLTSLTHLNLSNNGFTGKIPDFLAYMPMLHVIDLSGNNLTGPVPHELVEKASNKSIDLRLQGNPYVCKSYPCEEKMEFNKKGHHFIIPVVTCVALVSFLVIIGIIFIAFKREKKQVEGLVDRSIKSRNKHFNFSEIVSITDHFRKVLGKGGFGTVYYGVLHDGTQVAVKVLNSSTSTITLKQFCAETELLTRVHHVNLVSLIGYCDEHANMALVYEFMSCGNLQMHLSERNEHPLSWKARLQISIDVAQGLEYLHSSCRPPIIHRDIKPANILLDEMGRAKIADFGLSRFFTIDSQGVVVTTDFAGTRGYLDPEYCKLMNSLSEKSDVYAFGIVLLQLLSGQPAIIKNTNDKDNIVYISQWVSPMIESGDMLSIADKRLHGEYSNVNSAWKFLEIAMECVKPTGDQRPAMSKVVADLKLCYESEGFHVTNASTGIDDGTYYTNSIQAFDSSIVSLPSAR